MSDESAALAATNGEHPSPAAIPSATPTVTDPAPTEQVAAGAAKQPTATTTTPAGSGKGSAGRACSKCTQTKPRTSYSKGQWEKSAKQRKCQQCLQPSSSGGDAVIAADDALQHKQPEGTTPATTEPSANLPPAAASKPSKPSKKSKQIAGTTTMLVTNDGEFTPAAAIVFNEIFERFDTDRDGAWSMQEVQAYANATNGKPFNTEELVELKSNFVCNDKGYLLKQGYFDLYYMHSLSQPRETFKDLQKLGYTSSLERVGQAQIAEQKT